MRLREDTSDQTRSPRPRIGFTRFLLRLLGWGFVVLLLRLLFVFRHLLLLVLFLVFLATLVSHACSFFRNCDLTANQRYHNCGREESLRPNRITPTGRANAHRRRRRRWRIAHPYSLFRVDMRSPAKRITK